MTRTISTGGKWSEEEITDIVDFGEDLTYGETLSDTESIKAEKIKKEFNIKIKQLLELKEGIIKNSYEDIINVGIEEIINALSRAKRKIKYTTDIIQVPRLEEFIDDETKIKAKGAILPFLEERQVENPDYEDIRGQKVDIVSQEMQLVDKSILVELPPEPIVFQIHFNDGILNNLKTTEYYLDMIKHVEYLFILLNEVGRLLGEDINIKICVDNENEIEETKELLSDLNNFEMLIFEVKNTFMSRRNNNRMEFRVRNIIEKGFELYSGDIDMFPANLKQEYEEHSKSEVIIRLQETLNKTKETVHNYILDALKEIYEI